MPNMSSTTAFVIALLASAHIVMELIHLMTLFRARKALRPGPNVMAGMCCYQLRRPRTGPLEEMYCEHPDLSGTIDAPERCETCDDRVLPYEGYKYLEQIHLNDFEFAFLQRLLSMAVGVLALLVAFKNILK